MIDYPELRSEVVQAVRGSSPQVMAALLRTVTADALIAIDETRVGGRRRILTVEKMLPSSCHKGIGEATFLPFHSDLVEDLETSMPFASAA